MTDHTVLSSIQRHDYLSPLQELFAKKMWVESLMLDAKKEFSYKGESKFGIPAQYQLPETVMAGLGATVEPSAVTGSAYMMPWDVLTQYIVMLEVSQGLKALLSSPHPNAGKIDAFAREMDGIVKVGALDMDWFLMNGGSTGLLGVVTAADNVDKKVALVSNRGVRPGMTVDFFSNAATKTGSALAITGKDFDGEVSVTFGSTANLGSVSAGHLMYKTGIHTTVTNILPNSFGDLVKSTGSIHNTALASNPWFSAFEMSNGGSKRDITLDLLNTAMSKVRNNGRAVPTTGMLEPDLYAALAKRLREENQPTQTMPTKDGLPPGLTYQYLDENTKFYSIPPFLRNTAILLTLKNFVKYHNGEDRFLRFGSDGKAGGSILQKVSGHLKERGYYSFWRQYANLDPMASVRINDLNGLSEET